MRILVVSDVHVEKYPENVYMFDGLDMDTAGKIDAAIVAGDTNRAPVLVTTLDRLIPQRINHIAFVTGNHDYRDTGLTIEEADDLIFRDVESFNEGSRSRRMVFLSAKDASSLTLSKSGDDAWAYRIIGDCQWGSDTEVDTEAEKCEYKRIKGFTPEEGRLRYELAEAHLDGELAAEEDDGHRLAHIVVTHHLPDVMFQPGRYVPTLPTGPFAGNMMSVVQRRNPPLWVYGHTHGGIDRRVGETVFLNPAVGQAARQRVKNPYIVTLEDGKVSKVESLVWL